MKLGLLSKMLLFILAPVLLGTVILTSVSYYMGDSMIQDQIDNDSKIVLDTAGTGIDAIFTGIRETLIFLSQNARILKAISAYAEGGPQAFTEELRDDTGKVFYNFVQSSALIRGSLLIGADGLVLSGSLQGQPHAKEEVGKNYSERNFFRTAVQEGRTSYTTIFLPSGEVQIVLAEPIRKDGRIIGVVSCRLLSAFVSKQTTERVHVGKKGETYAYNYQGKVILADQGTVGRDDAMLPHVRTMIQQKEGKLLFKNNDGEKFLYFKDLPQLRWILCVEVDKSEIMAPTYSLLRNLTLCAVVIGLIIGGIIFFAAKSMASSVGGIAGLANAVAGGRLEATASEEAFMTQTERRGDELSTLSTAMRKMILNLKKLMEESEEKTHAAEQATRDAQEATKRAEEATKVAERAKRDGMLDAASRLESMVKGISEAAGELSAQIEQSDRGSQQSSQRLSEAATAMNEMNATVQEVAQNASSASNFSSRTKGNAEEGQKILTNAMSSISQARNVSMELKDDMSKLHEHTQNISQIMNVISDIADQTNLLALNAAIEAARAGEAGRGFAVVADEVRKLAEKTMASTNDVSQAITAIQSSAQQSVNRMEEALQNVEQATISAQQSGEALNKIVSDVEETADQVRAIATASEEQSAASEEITQSIANVADMSSQTTQSMSEAARAISDLAEQTTRLSTLIEEMKQG